MQKYGATPEQAAGGSPDVACEELRLLLALPVEVVLPAHGAPTNRAALERAPS